MIPTSLKVRSAIDILVCSSVLVLDNSLGFILDLVMEQDL